MAFGSTTISSFASAADDLFSIDGLKTKASGYRLEAINYRDAAGFADKNARFAEMSTQIQDMQNMRKGLQVTGGIMSDVAGSGFSESGSALDIIRDSVSQLSLERAVASYQGLIQEEGYQQQAASYRNMATAAEMAAVSADKAAKNKKTTAIAKAVIGGATFFM